ncbi:MAG: amidohydrolase family protein [Rhodospirillales bacterium]|nr:amidohydrolase family protein [Rhodospirillales bacterium]
MKIVDPHHHLWDLENNYYPWLCDEMGQAVFGDYTPLRKSYLISDLLADAADLELIKSVHLQAEYDPSDPVGETRWLQSIADSDASGGLINGIVGYCNFALDGAEQLLEQHCAHKNFRGVRHLLNIHDDPAYNYADQDYLNNAKWTENYGLLDKFNLSYDLQIYYPQMADAARLAARYPQIQVILNHTGMPHERNEAGFKAWQAAMKTLAAQDNVAVKISGLGMIDHNWTVASLQPYVLETIAIFGVERAMFASNFPVDKLFSSYKALWDAFDEITKTFSDAERHALFCSNAEKFYRI